MVARHLLGYVFVCSISPDTNLFHAMLRNFRFSKRLTDSFGGYLTVKTANRKSKLASSKAEICIATEEESASRFRAKPIQNFL